MAASEVAPYASTGGLGDVAAALPKALAGEHDGVHVARVMPLYRQVHSSAVTITNTGIRFDIPMGTDTVPGEIWQAEEGGVTTYLVRNDPFFDREALYSQTGGDYPDNLERFAFFQKAVVSLIDALPHGVDIVHCNDWQTGLIPLYLEHGIDGTGRHGKEKTVFTIHNLAFQGLYPATALPLTNLPSSTLSADQLEFYGQIGCLKGGIRCSDLVTTVSKTYAKEIQTEELGCGLHQDLVALGHRLSGVVNGVDYNVWNPSTDEYLPANYDAEDLSGKQVCKKALLKEMGLPSEPELPLLGIVTRLADQKGIDLLAGIMDDLMELDVQLVLLGSGQEKYHQLCKRWAASWPDRFAARLTFDPPLSHRIEAGADMFLMPSRFEPCGLNQLYSLRYGTVPVVHATGGLEDTIEDIQAGKASSGTGFKFSAYTEVAFMESIQRALKLYARPSKWRGVASRCMRQDFSWVRAAAQYLQLYESLISSSSAVGGP